MKIVGALSVAPLVTHAAIAPAALSVGVTKSEGLAGIIVLFLTGLTFKVLLKDTSGQERLANYWERAAREKDARIDSLEHEVTGLRQEIVRLQEELLSIRRSLGK